jgi:hypothetical protein
MSATRKCLFCGRVLPPKRAKAGGKSDEHVVARWLLEHLGIGSTTIAPAHLNVKSGNIIHTRHHTLNNLVGGSVCRDCNNGWMSELESQAKPILTALIADPNRLSTLQKADRRILARWTFKTAAIFNRSSSYGNPAISQSHPVPDRHLLTLKGNAVPDDVAVVAGECTCDRSFDFFQGDNWGAPEDSFPLQPEDQQKSYKIGLSFRDLLLAVVFFPNPEYHYAVVERAYYQLWAGARGIVPWRAEMDKSPLFSASPIIEGFVRTIGVVSKTWWEIRENEARTRLVIPAGMMGRVTERLEIAFFEGRD